jgi:hypothetical protein
VPNEKGQKKTKGAEIGFWRARRLRQLFEIRPTTTVIAENKSRFLSLACRAFSVVFPKGKTAGVSQLFT